MKKILTIALVAVLAATSVFAGVNFSGRFRQGYKFTFADGEDPTGSAWKTEEAKFIIKATDDDGIWTVSLKNMGKVDVTDDEDKEKKEVVVGILDSNDKWAANASVNLTKALAKAGVDTGDFGLSVSLGNNERMTALSAYTDPNGDEYYKLKNNGKESVQFAASYGKLVKFNVAFDPTNAGGSTVVSASTTPINGVSVAAAYAYNGWMEDSYYKLVGKNMLGFSAAVDVAKLADLDFKLSVSAYDNMILKTGDDVFANSFAANVAGGVEKVDGYVEFFMHNDKEDTTCGILTQANFNVVENLGLDAYFAIGNFSKAGDTWKLGADASYKLAGVEFALNAEYARVSKAFSVTPKMIIVF